MPAVRVCAGDYLLPIESTLWRITLASRTPHEWQLWRWPRPIDAAALEDLDPFDWSGFELFDHGFRTSALAADDARRNT